MAVAVQSIKQMAHDAIDNMADSVTWNDIVETMRFNQAVDDLKTIVNNQRLKRDQQIAKHQVMFDDLIAD